MEGYNVPFAILAGSNKGRHKEMEISDKNKTGKLYNTQFLDGDTKLYEKLSNGKSVLENTLEAAFPVASKKPAIIGDSDRLRKEIGDKAYIEEQYGESLSDNVYQMIDFMREIGENSGFVLMGGDLPSVSTDDLEEFVQNSYEKNKDVVMGLVDMDEMRYAYERIRSPDTEWPKKFGIRFKDKKCSYTSCNPKLTFGTVFFIKDTLYEKNDLLHERMDEIIRLKRVFNEKENYPIIAEFLKDHGKAINKPPKNRLSLAYFALTNSTPLRRMLFGNLLSKAKNDYSMDVSELEELIEHKVLDNRLSFGIVRAPPMFGYDIDDKNDITIADNIIRARYQSENQS
ncbi:MAG: hypothetical protein ACLFTR_04235 [Candidatus Woesearchaeota archaeon]